MDNSEEENKVISIKIFLGDGGTSLSSQHSEDTGR